jgi:hypothetical protein
MAEDTRALRAEIVGTREELGETVQDLSAHLAPRRQAQQAVASGVDAAMARLRTLSQEDVSAAAARARAAIEQHPQAAAAAGAVTALLVLRRRRRR